MRRSISDLRGWPIGVWVASGPGRSSPDAATARLKSAKARGSNIHLTVADERGEYSSALTADSAAEAQSAARALSDRVNAHLDELGRVEFETPEEEVSQ